MKNNKCRPPALLMTDMKVTKISKERLGAYVAFPRTQCKGLTEPLDVRQDEFKIVEVNDVPGMGTAKLIEAVNTPRRVYQLFLPDNETQFDDYLGKLLGMHESPTYIDGNTSFIIIFQGNHDSVEINQLNYKEVVAAIRKDRERAAAAKGNEDPDPEGKYTGQDPNKPGGRLQGDPPISGGQRPSNPNPSNPPAQPPTKPNVPSGAGATRRR